VLLAGIGWNGSDPVAEGWLSFAPTRSGATQVSVRVGGASATSDARALTFLNGVTPTSIDPQRDLIVR